MGEWRGREGGEGEEERERLSEGGERGVHERAIEGDGGDGREGE
jgi:hypothetical protein